MNSISESKSCPPVELDSRLTFRAIEAAMALPATTLEPDPLLKLSGLYITMSSMFETTYQPIKAFSSLREALPHFGEEPLAKDTKYRISSPWSGSRPLSEEEHKLVIGITQKLGQMALQLSSTRVPPPFPLVEGKSPKDWESAAEEYLSSALTAMLRLGLKPGKSGAVAGRDVDLPAGAEGEEESGSGRVDKRGLGMTMEALAEVYARRGQYDLAGNLLLQAVSTLLPPQSKEPPPMSDRCQGKSLIKRIYTLADQSSGYGEYLSSECMDCTNKAVDDYHFFACPSAPYRTSHQGIQVLVAEIPTDRSASTERERRSSD